VNRPYHWFDRLLIALACVGAVILLCLAPGCEDETAQRFRACGQMCGGHAAHFSMEKSGWVWQPVCVCGSASADGGRP